MVAPKFLLKAEQNLARRFARKLAGIHGLPLVVVASMFER
jgi:hypothetical protein